MHKYNKPLKIIFAGTPNFAAYHLKQLLSSHHNILTVLTQPDRPNYRNKKIILSPVKKIAQQYNIPIIQIHNLKNQEEINKIFPQSAEIMVVVAYGMILPSFLLNRFPLGCINIHGSLLPKFRGPAPIQWTLIKNENTTGITAIQMNQDIDSGNILYKMLYKIHPKDNNNVLTEKLSALGIKTLLQTLIKIQKKNHYYIKQKKYQVTYAKKITKSMGRINFFMSAQKIITMIKALNPWPGTYIKINNQIIKIHKAKIIKSDNKWNIGKIIIMNSSGIFIQTQKNILKILKIQVPGKKINTISEFINSKQKFFTLGQVLI
ncbi:Methionyl-tRNA formyltransferase [Buchnera aphidicola (Myzocallis carpini)]